MISHNGKKENNFKPKEISFGKTITDEAESDATVRKNNLVTYKI